MSGKLRKKGNWSLNQEIFFFFFLKVQYYFLDNIHPKWKIFQNCILFHYFLIQGKAGDRPGSLELGGRSTRMSVGRSAPQQQPPMVPPGVGGVPPNVNPLLFLTNPQMHAVPPTMLGRCF